MKTKKTNPKKPAATPAKTKRAAAKSARAKGNAKRTETPPPSNPAKVAPVPAVAPATWRPNWIEADESRKPTPKGCWPGGRPRRVPGESGRRFPVPYFAFPPFPEDSTASGTARALRLTLTFRRYARQVLTNCGFKWEAFEETGVRLVSWRLRYPLALDCNMIDAQFRALPPPPASAGREAAAEFAAFKFGTRSWWRRWELIGRCVALYNSTARAASRGLPPGSVAAAVEQCADDFRQVRKKIKAAQSAGWMSGERALPLSPEWLANGRRDGGPIYYRTLFDTAVFRGKQTGEAAVENLDEAERDLSSTFAAALERFAGLLTGEEGAPTDAPPASPSNPATGASAVEIVATVREEVAGRLDSIKCDTAANRETLLRIEGDKAKVAGIQRASGRIGGRAAADTKKAAREARQKILDALFARTDKNVKQRMTYRKALEEALKTGPVPVKVNARFPNDPLSDALGLSPEPLPIETLLDYYKRYRAKSARGPKRN